METLSEKLIKVAENVPKVYQAGYESAVKCLPVIGENQNWWVWDFETSSYIDSGVSAEGKEGYTPIKGVDYWTEEDKAEIANEASEIATSKSGWKLIREDVLTENTTQYKVTTDADGNPLALKKVMVEVYADTTNGVYASTGSTAHLLFELCQLNTGIYWAKTGWASAPFPTTEGKVSYVRMDAEVIGTNAFTTFSTQKNADGFGYTQLNQAATVTRSQAFPLKKDNIGMVKLTATGGMKAGTKIVVWGCDA